MRNHRAAIARRLADPDFQGGVVTKCLALTLGMGALLGVSLLHDAYVWANPAEPRYFIVDGKNPPRPIVAVDSPIVDDTELLQWSVKAILAVYNYDFRNYASQLNVASRRFTRNGWSTFASSFVEQKNLGKLIEATLLCGAQTQRAALIHQTSYVRGALAYDVQVPIAQSCANNNQTLTNYLMITARVIRTNSDDHPDGLAIDQLVAKVTQ